MSKDKLLIKKLGFLVILLLLGAQQMSLINSQTGDSEVARLITFLRSQKIQERDPQQVARAIEQLGQMRSTAAIDDLIKLITFKRTYEWERIPGIDTVNEIHPITPFGRYPALGALFSIGRPSLPALIKVIEENGSETLAGQNATITVVTIFRENFSEAVKYLTDAATKASAPESKERLLEAAEIAKTYVK